MLPLHPTVRAELAIGAAVFCTGAAIGALIEAANLIARARRAEREQLKAAGALVEQLADECHQLRGQAAELRDRYPTPDLFELAIQERDHAREERDGQGRRADRYARLIAFVREHGGPEVAVALEAADAALAVADGTVTALPRHIVRAAIEQADSGELVRDAIAQSRCACVRGAELCDDCRPPAGSTS